MYDIYEWVQPSLHQKIRVTTAKRQCLRAPHLLSSRFRRSNRIENDSIMTLLAMLAQEQIYSFVDHSEQWYENLP